MVVDKRIRLPYFVHCGFHRREDFVGQSAAVDIAECSGKPPGGSGVSVREEFRQNWRSVQHRRQRGAHLRLTTTEKSLGSKNEGALALIEKPSRFSSCNTTVFSNYWHTIGPSLPKRPGFSRTPRPIPEPNLQPPN